MQIEHVLYINLESRPDRQNHVERQLQKIGIRKICVNRFNAIKLADGRIGCSMSHLKCLQIAKENNWPHLLICEDDILFLKPDLFKRNLTKFLESNISWDVVLLAGNNIPPYQRICEEYIKVSRCQTTTAYLIKSHYYDTLMNNIKIGMQLLMREPTNHIMYAIDKYWFQLQLKDNWFLITPLTVIQREDYSDIEKRNTDYKHLMLDLDKSSFMRF